MFESTANITGNPAILRTDPTNSTLKHAGFDDKLDDDDDDSDDCDDEEDGDVRFG
jgi:hypothetical protein